MLANRKLAWFAPLLLLSACNITWPGQGRGTGEASTKNVDDIAALQGQYDTTHYFESLRRRKEGLENAFGRDLDSITATIDRHFFNYSADDPHVNHPSSASHFNHLMRFGLNTTYPMVSYVETGSIVRR